VKPEPAADPTRMRAATVKNPERDGVPLTPELIRRKAEHNEGMLHNLEEIALHQLDIDKIESLNNCRCLRSSTCSPISSGRSRTWAG